MLHLTLSAAGLCPRRPLLRRPMVSPVHMRHPGPPLTSLPCCSCAGTPPLTAAGGSRPADTAQHVGRQRQLIRRLPRRVSHAQVAPGLLCHATACHAAATACPSSPTLCSCCVRICMCRHSRASTNPIPHPVMNVKDEMEEDEDVEEHQSFLAGVFGVIYTVSRVSAQVMHVQHNHRECSARPTCHPGAPVCSIAW